ncbi:MAG: hypothetical protein J0H98_00675 [Solirubrobacterales bacterium]|nr:hypothetical protein [Solirubrobacterales bacterium]
MTTVDVFATIAPILTGSVGVWWGAKVTRKSAAEARQHQDRRAREAELIELRAAARLLDEQFSNVQIAISRSLVDQNWPRIDCTVFNESVWAENRSVLARLLDEDEWYQVTEAVRTSTERCQRGSVTEGDLMHEGQTRLIKSFHGDIEKARDVLRHHRAAGSIVHVTRNKPS